MKPDPEIDTAPCARCNGSGRVPLSIVDTRILGALAAEWRPTSKIEAKVKIKEPKIKRNTLCMRLSRLVIDGLVEKRVSQEEPRGFDWRRIGTSP